MHSGEKINIKVIIISREVSLKRAGIGLPPLGIFGIPFSVTGTQSNPVVKLKRGEDGKLADTEEEQ